MASKIFLAIGFGMTSPFPLSFEMTDGQSISDCLGTLSRPKRYVSLVSVRLAWGEAGIDCDAHLTVYMAKEHAGIHICSAKVR